MPEILFLWFKIRANKKEKKDFFFSAKDIFISSFQINKISRLWLLK